MSWGHVQPCRKIFYFRHFGFLHVVCGSVCCANILFQRQLPRMTSFSCIVTKFPIDLRPQIINIAPDDCVTMSAVHVCITKTFRLLFSSQIMWLRWLVNFVQNLFLSSSWFTRVYFKVHTFYHFKTNAICICTF